VAVEREKILVIGPSWVGDMVMAQSLFMTLRQQNSLCSIDVLAPAWSFPLLERMPEVDKAVAMPLTHGQFGFLARRQLGHQLRNNQYNRAIVLPSSWKSALIPFFAGIPLRTGYLGELRWGLLNDTRRLDKQLLRMTVQRFVALGLQPDVGLPPTCPTPKLTIDAKNQEKVQEKFGVTGQRKILALCPGAEYGPAKRWPATHYAELAREKLAKGWAVWLFGSAKDQPVTEEINRLSDSACHDFSGATSLGEAVDLMSMADAVVSNDSGLMHVAAALGKPLIAIYGSSDPGFTPPLNQDASILNLQLDCSPCFKRDCPLGHTRCLTEITPQQVSAKIIPH
jgi:lipopolysaccharide heptosyltransferase II